MADVAVVVVCHDLGRTLEAAVDSVLVQTQPAAEIVVVDDGSTDVYTRQVLARLARPRTRVIVQANAGPAAARAHGVRLTTAPYLVLLDADDMLAPTYLEKAAARLDADPALHFVSCAMQAAHRPDAVRQPPDVTLAERLGRGALPVPTMMRRSLWEAVGGFDPTLPAAEDTDFWVSALARGFRGEVLDEPRLAQRHRRSSRWSRGVADDVHRAAMRAIYLKHWPAVDGNARDILQARESALLEQRAHRDHLVRRKRDLEHELDGLRREIREAGDMLRGRGRAPVEWADLARTTPLSPFWGVERGRPLDRPLLERFLDRHRADIAGRVLEVKDPGYAERFGGGRVTRCDVLDIDATNPRATIVADLARADSIPSDTYDCFILTQTLNLVFDVRAALHHAVRVLKPGGVLLCTLPAVTRVDPETGGFDGDFWRFSEASARRLLAELLPPEAFDVVPVGNVHLCAAFLYGLALDEVEPDAREAVDPWFPLFLCVRAVKPRTIDRAPAIRRHATGGAAVLMYHRVATPRDDATGLAIAPTDFRAQMEHLRRAWQPMALAELARSAAAGTLDERAVAVTLDDGYLDGLETAAPILAELQIPATFFVTAAALEAEQEFWWDMLARALLDDAPVAPALRLDVDGRRLELPTTTVAERRRAHAFLSERLSVATLVERQAVLAELARWRGHALSPRPSHRAMTGQEVVTLAARPGITIGAHGVHHLYLPRQPLHVRIVDVLDSRARLEACLGHPVTLFAYPYGGVDADTVDVVRGARFDVAVTTDPRAVAPGDDALRVPRLDLSQLDPATFAERLVSAARGRTW